MPIVLVAGPGCRSEGGLAILRARPDVELVVIEDPDAEISHASDPACGCDLIGTEFYRKRR